MPDTNNSTEVLLDALNRADFDFVALIECPDSTTYLNPYLGNDLVSTVVGVNSEFADVMLVFSDSPWVTNNTCASGSYSLSPDEARKIAAALIEAATEADRRRRNDGVEPV